MGSRGLRSAHRELGRQEPVSGMGNGDRGGYLDASP